MATQRTGSRSPQLRFPFHLSNQLFQGRPASTPSKPSPTNKTFLGTQRRHRIVPRGPRRRQVAHPPVGRFYHRFSVAFLFPPSYFFLSLAPVPLSLLCH